MKSTLVPNSKSKIKYSFLTLILITSNILLLTCSIITIWYQRHELYKLNEDIKLIKDSSLSVFEEMTVRKRRDIGLKINTEGSKEFINKRSPIKSFFAPLYTAITEDMIDQLCGERKLFNSNNDIGEKNLENIVVMTLDKGKQGPQYMSTDLTVNEEKSKVRTKEMIKDIEKFKKIRTCSRIVGIGLKTLHGDKRYYQSGIVKKGNSWYVTEFNTGYTVFEIEHHKGIVDFNNPKEIYTLSTPFIGNNHAISPTTDDFFYITDDGTYLTKFNLKSLTSGSIKKFPIIKDNINIYSQVNGTSAIHVDSGYAWLVYNKDQNNHLTISRIDKNNLEEIRRIKLNKFDRKISSSFISCGIFYGIECAGIQCRILPIYDLIHGKYVLRKDKFNVVGHWNSYGNIKSVSYDSVTHMLAILDDDKIYSIQLKVL